MSIRACSFLILAAHLRGKRKAHAIRESLETAKRIKDELIRASLLGRIGTNPAAADHLTEIYEAVELIDSKELRDPLLHELESLPYAKFTLDHIPSRIGSLPVARQNEEGPLPHVDIRPPQLPDTPSQLWEPRPAGRPLQSTAHREELFAFIREVYGSLLKSLTLRNQMRAYIFRKDPRLYRAIVNYESRNGELPHDIRMPAKPSLVQQRLEKAKREGLGKLSKPERRSVVGKLLRMERREEPKS